MFELDEETSEMIKENIKKELISLGCKDLSYFMDTYTETIIEAINEAYNIEIDYMEQKINKN